MSDVVERRLRADAERNRARILEAAGELFAERGLEVSMDEIAAAAGVGVGTVYRRFADREALIDALFERKGEEILGYAQRALLIEDPWEGLATFVRDVCRSHAEDRGLKEVLMCSAGGGDRVDLVRERIRPVAGQVLQRAKDAGVVRADAETFDIPMLHFAVGFVAERTRAAAPDFYQRVLTIMLDGLRTPEPTPMPVPPLSAEQFAASLTRRR